MDNAKVAAKTQQISDDDILAYCKDHNLKLISEQLYRALSDEAKVGRKLENVISIISGFDPYQYGEGAGSVSQAKIDMLKMIREILK